MSQKLQDEGFVKLQVKFNKFFKIILVGRFL